MRRGWVALLACALIGLGGCSDDGADSSPRPATSPSETGPTDQPSTDPGLDDGLMTELIESGRSSVERILSYDYRTLDQDARAAAMLMTAEFSGKYAALIDALRETAVTQEASTRASAVGAGLVGLEDDEAAVLVFVDQTTRRGSETPTTVANASIVKFERVGDRWLVSALETGAVASSPEAPEALSPSIQAATTFAEAFLGISADTVADDLAAVLAASAPPFRDDFRGRADLLRRTLTGSGAATSVVVRSVGVEDHGLASGTVILAAEVTTTLPGKAPALRPTRMRVHLTTVDGVLKVDVVEIVGATGG